MPTFDFKCPKCKHLWEANITFVDSEFVGWKAPKCPECGGLGDKQPSTPSFIIKGFSAKNGYSG